MNSVSGESHTPNHVMQTSLGRPSPSRVEIAVRVRFWHRPLPHARARERVVPISELVFGTLTQNRSSLEPSPVFAAIAGPPCIVDRVPYVQALEEPKRDPKRLWRTRLDDDRASRPQTGPQNLGAHAGTQCYSVPPSIRKSTAKGPPFSMRGVPAIAAPLRFWVKVPNTSSEIGTTLSRARACARGDRANSARLRLI